MCRRGSSLTLTPCLHPCLPVGVRAGLAREQQEAEQGRAGLRRVPRHHRLLPGHGVASKPAGVSYRIVSCGRCLPICLPTSISYIYIFEYADLVLLKHCIVLQALRRSAMSAEPTAVVQFVGDADETGQTPHRVIPLRYVMRLPV